MFLYNGDKCSINQHVIVQKPNPPSETFVGVVKEILQIKGSNADLSRQPEAILIQAATSTRPSTTYRMPFIELTDIWCLIPLQV